MPEARDRLVRQEDGALSYSRRLRFIRMREASQRNSNPIIFILPDETEVARETPVRWRNTPMTGPIAAGATGIGVGGVAGRRFHRGTPRNGQRRNLHTPRPAVIGRENSHSAGRGRGRGSMLPSWYPRTPLRDITAVMRAIERRTLLREDEGLQTESFGHQDQTVADPSPSTSGAQLEHNISMKTPNPTVGMRRCPPSSVKRCPPSIGKVPKILLDVIDKNDEEGGFVTPQKKLLDSIDAVEKVVMEEIKKLKRTPLAKREEREKKVRTLMSMR